MKNVSIFPASHFVVSDEKLQAAIVRIKKELQERLEELKNNNKLLAAEKQTGYNKNPQQGPCVNSAFDSHK